MDLTNGNTVSHPLLLTGPNMEETLPGGTWVARFVYGTSPHSLESWESMSAGKQGARTGLAPDLGRMRKSLAWQWAEGDLSQACVHFTRLPSRKGM